MEIQQIKYFVALAHEQSFQKAARRVFVTQPTLSQQIKKMEEDLHVPLFERKSSGVKLTEAGEKFLPFAVSILDHLEKGITLLQEESTDLVGTLAVGAIPTIGPYLFPQILMRIRKEAPRLKIVLYEETTSVLIESIKKGKIDIGILSLPIVDRGLVCKSIGYEEFYLAVARKHPLAKRKQVSPAIIKEERMLILQEGHCFADQALEFCKRQRHDSQVVFEGSSLTSVMGLVAVGEGVTLVPTMATNFNECETLAFIPFQAPKPKREIGLVWRISAPLSKTQHYFLDLVEDVFLSK